MVWRTRLYELYIHPSSAGLLKESGRCAAGDSEEVRLICPMDILVRDQTWLNTFFDYSYTFEYFRGLERAIQDMATFHGTKDIVEKKP